jgi:hypothetical protein
MVDDSTIRGRSREALAIQVLTEALRILERAHDTPHVRELRAKARVYETAIKGWATLAPTEPQLEAIFELVKDLHGKVVATERRR